MSDRTRLIALYCVEPEHDGHDDLLRFPTPVRTVECGRCLLDEAERRLGTRHLLKVEVMHINQAYILYVTQITRERTEYGVSEGHLLFAPCNLRQRLVAAPRFNAKTFASLSIEPTTLSAMVHRSRLLKAETDAKDADAAARQRVLRAALLSPAGGGDQ